MSNIKNLDQQIANLQINHSDEAVKAGKKVGPAVPPKPKKSQPQVGKLIIFFSISISHNINAFFMHHSLFLYNGKSSGNCLHLFLHLKNFYFL